MKNEMMEGGNITRTMHFGEGAMLHSESSTHHVAMGDFTFWISGWLRLKSETKH